MTHPDITADLTARMPDLRGRLLANQPLAPFTWLRVGGPAQALFTPADTEDLAYFLTHLPADLPLTIIGLASNMIIRDGGIPGVVIRLQPKAFGQVEVLEGACIRAGAMAADRTVGIKAAEAGIGGLEFLFGIPGSIGGALRMNAGTRSNTNPDIEGETRERFVSATGVTRAGEIVTLSPDDMKFEYRSSRIAEGIVFTEVVLQGFAKPVEDVLETNRKVQEHRERDQETKVRTAGSTFKNPPGHSSWKLIDAAGCRGLTVGKARMSEKHCNFLIAEDGATAAEIEALGELVRARVKATSGVEFEWEVKRVGVLR